ncbi:hypothetical protein ABC347_03635 [Sphingomonas sp. 1P06PA]|uniref:hypothetical protein n=1 Tax=Sphingomonas sp. 1P06PA TaxID=554121 RepID=UPI0039A696A8
MSADPDMLYALLPAIHRLRDGEAGEPLRALLAAIGRELAIIEEDVEQLSDDLFIETAADWAIPYLGALVGYRPLRAPAGNEALARAEVAHTIALRRRKGTLAAIEAAARDATGWAAHGVEFFRSLARTQWLNHVERDRPATASVRNVAACGAAGTPFDRLPRTIDVRRIASGRGRHNISNVAVFVWPVDGFARTDTPAVALDDRRLLVNPLGCDTPLWHRGQSEASIATLAGPLAAPGPIGLRELARDLSSGAPALYGRDADGQLLGVELSIDGAAVPADRIRACRLEDWAHDPADGIALDPALGRIMLPIEDAGKSVTMRWHEGFTAAIGGGEYARIPAIEGMVVAVPGPQASTIDEALQLLGGNGTVLLTDNGRHTLPAEIAVADGGQLRIVAEEGYRPLLVSPETMVVTGGPDSGFGLDGVLLAGDIVSPDRTGNALARLWLRDATLVPGRTLLPDSAPGDPGAPSLTVSSGGTAVTIERTILGPVLLDRHATLSATDTIIDATALDLVALEGGTIGLRRTTVIGRVAVAAIDTVEDCLLIATGASPAVSVERRQQGCVRFSWLPADARVPRRFRCLPDGDDRAVPATASLRYGHPLYARLDLPAGSPLATAASDEGEPGAFNHVGATRRLANLAIRLAEQVPAGIEIGIVQVTEG